MPEKSTSEINLIKRLVTKEQSAWKELYNSYSRELTSVCRRYLKGHDDIHDVLQNSFIKMFHHIHSFDYLGSGSLKAWMTRIVINEILQYLRKNSKMEFSSIEDELPLVVDEQEPELNNIPLEELLNMIKALPDGYRVVFNLYVFENKSHVEISRLLSISESSSASQLHKAKRKLANQINSYKQFKKSGL